MLSKTSALLIIALCFHWTQCDVLVITADNQLSEVCVNDASIALGPYASKIARLDRMSLPAGWNDDGYGCIAVKAYNNRAVTREGGILACVDSEHSTALFWQCAAPSQLTQSCCSSCGDPAWDAPSFGRITMSKAAQRGKQRAVASLPAQCRVGERSSWIWDDNRVQTRVCCRAKPCASGCKSCRLSGPGGCDSGKCMFGSTGQLTSPVCKYKCCVEVRLSQGDRSFPAIKIVNQATGKVYNSPSGASQIALWIDITTCTPGDYYETEEPIGTTMLINTWAQNSSLVGNVIVDVASGTDFGLMWVGVQQFGDGQGMIEHVNPMVYTSAIAFVSFCITGYPMNITTQVVTVNDMN